MALCGYRYRSLLTNALGYTPDNPCGPYCNDADHAAWNNAARSLLVDKLEPAWDAYVAATGDKPDKLMVGRIFLVRNRILSSLFEDSAFNLPGTNLDYITATIAAMEVGICLLENLQDATEAAGGKPAEVPGTTPPRPTKASTVGQFLGYTLLAVGLGGAAYLAVTHVRKKRSAAELGD